ncbi:MAG TPA: signal peptide peptidase SppA [Cyclobacteriaceae bacterium]|nr:signal peptide peptidase SppA [Cyclobacteriaceae bacterium]
MGFLKNILSSCLGALVAMMLLIVFLILLISVATQEREEVIADNSVLHLKLNGPINELQRDTPIPLPGVAEPNIGLMQLHEAIRHAQGDPKIKGIYLEVNQPVTFYSTLEEIRLALLDFKKSGKWVVAYNEVMSEGAYYLASAADEIYLHPEGDLEFNGLTANFTSFKKLFDKLEIKPEVFRVGEFKSAVEPFLLEKMSDENRLQLSEMINSIYSTMLLHISESRNIPLGKLKEISDKMLVRNAADAVAMGLVDSLLYKDQFHEIIRNKLDLGEDDDISFVNYHKYHKSFSVSSASKNEIAVIVAEGTIVPGSADQSDPVIGADTYVDEIRKARENDRVKAIVLRVNSPGGEYRSSDMIWREVLLASEKKPVIASMGDFAASGGYYISMACDTIVAQPETVTGSIGIFGIMFDMSNFFDHKLGITFEEIKTGEFGEMYTVTRPLTDAEKRHWQEMLDENYEKFLDKAGQGRHTSKDEIRKVAAGRVWTGIQAREHGLVDVLGGFYDALRIAAEKADIADDYKVRFYPKPKSFIEQLLSEAQESSQVSSIRRELGDHYIFYQHWKKIKEYKGSQARLPFEFTLQ